MNLQPDYGSLIDPATGSVLRAATLEEHTRFLKTTGGPSARITVTVGGKNILACFRLPMLQGVPRSLDIR